MIEEKILILQLLFLSIYTLSCRIGLHSPILRYICDLYLMTTRCSASEVLISTFMLRFLVRERIGEGIAQPAAGR